MKLSLITEGMQTIYYVPMPGTEEELHDIPDSAESVRCWQDTPDSVNAMSEWLNGFVIFGEEIKEGAWSLYQFVGPKPISLPFAYTLNYVDIVQAEKISTDQLKESIQWLLKTDPTSEMIINSSYEETTWTKGQTTHQELVKVLSDIVKTMGPLVWCPEDTNNVMRHQVIATVPFKMTRINPDSIHDQDRQPEILDPDLGDKRIIGREDPEDEPDPADWWKEE
jgi:hypothetical protein